MRNGLLLLTLAISFGLGSCTKTSEKKLTLPQNAELADENDFYQLYTSVEDCDSVVFTVIWLMDKEDSSVIKVTDPAAILASMDEGIDVNDEELYMYMTLNDKSRSITSPSRANLANNVKHPWKVALLCFGYGHNYSTLIVTENKEEYEELCYTGFVCRSKHEDVVFFDQVDDYTDWELGNVTYFVSDNAMNVLRHKLTKINNGDTSMKTIIAEGEPVAISSIGDSIRSHNVDVYNEETGFSEDRKIVETQADNGDVVSYLVDEEHNKAVKLPVNDEFVCANNTSFVFLSYKTYDDGKRYSVLRLIDKKGDLRYEISGRSK